MASISNAIKMVVSGDAAGAKQELDALRQKVNAFTQDIKGAGNEGVKSFKMLREGLAGVGIVTVLAKMRALSDEIRNMPGVPEGVRDGMESFANGFDNVIDKLKIGVASVITFYGRVGEGIRSLVDSEFEADKRRLAMESEREKQIEANHIKGMERAKEIAETRERNAKAELRDQELIRKVTLEAMVAKAKAQDDADRKTRESAAKIKGDMMTEGQLRQWLKGLTDAITAAERELKKTKEGTIEYDRLLVQLTEDRAAKAEIVAAIEAKTVGTLNEQYAANLRLAGLNDEQIRQIMVQNGLLKEQLATETAITEQRQLGFKVRNATDPFEMSDEELAEKISNLRRSLSAAERTELMQTRGPGGSDPVRSSPGFRAEIERMEAEQDARRRFRTSYRAGTADTRFSATDFTRFERQYIQNGGTEGQKILDELQKLNRTMQDRMPVSNNNPTTF